MLGSARLLAQCGITVTAAELRIIDAPPSFQYFHTPTSRELLRNLKAPRPAVFFVEDTKNDPAFDAEAVGHANSARRPELVNTVWVAHGARDLPFGFWEMNWIAFNDAHDVALPGSSGKPLPFLMYPQAEVGGVRRDSLDPAGFRYQIKAKEVGQA